MPADNAAQGVTENALGMANMWEPQSPPRSPFFSSDSILAYRSWAPMSTKKSYWRNLRFSRSSTPSPSLRERGGVRVQPWRFRPSPSPPPCQGGGTKGGGVNNRTHEILRSLALPQNDTVSTRGGPKHRHLSSNLRTLSFISNYFYYAFILSLR